MLSRRVAVLMAAAGMAVMMLVMEAPAFGTANGHASCQGAAHSNQTEPGAAGDFHKLFKTHNGDVAKEVATAGERGQDKNNTGAVGPNFEICNPN